MRKHGWQLPYHPLQVVAISVFLALGFSFYVFFLPFVGRKVFEYVVMGLYTPLVSCVFCLYVWCAATDPADPGVYKSNKYLNIQCSGKECDPKNFNHGNSLNVAHAGAGNKPADECSGPKKLADHLQKESSACSNVPFFVVLLGWFPLSSVCSWFQAHEHSSEKQTSEDGMFYCSLCEVEVLKYSKHCRVCDKCVDGYDHHCRWLNNCIGRRNYGSFFVLMISALLLLILQWSIGVIVLILCFVERKRFSMEIGAKLGNSFSLVPFIIVVASCTFLAVVATLPLAQLFFFHVLLIKKGISTYDYIVALREQEQEQQGVGQQSPQMSSASSFTGLSSASSFSAFRRDAWCTPPRLFLEDQFDVIPPELGKSAGKKMMEEESARKRSAGTVKISPWTLARLNAEEVSRAAEQAKKKSKILRPVTRRETSQGHESDSSLGSGSGRMVPTIDGTRRKPSKRGRLTIDLPLEHLAKVKVSNRSERPAEISSTLAPLQHAARSAFRTSRAMSSAGITACSPDSSLDSPDLRPFCISSSGAAEDSRGLTPLPPEAAAAAATDRGIQLLRSISSDGYEASGGEDSDQVPSRIVHRSFNWANLLFGSDRADASSSSPSVSGLRSNNGSLNRPL